MECENQYDTEKKLCHKDKSSVSPYTIFWVYLLSLKAQVHRFAFIPAHNMYTKPVI